MPGKSIKSCKVWNREHPENLKIINDGFIIHHEDENQKNNDPKNLQKMIRGEHTRLHWSGKNHTEDIKKKISKAKMGQVPWNKGLETSEEIRRKSSESHKGQHSSSKTEFKKGNKPWNINKEITKDFLLMEYNFKKKSSLIIAKEIVVCKATILNYLRQFNICSRTPSEATQEFISRKIERLRI